MRDTFSLRLWATRAIYSSYPPGERAHAMHVAKSWLDFLDTLPVLA